MGFELDGFLGRSSALRTWESRLPSAVTCHLAGDLGLVPLTGALFEELRAWLGPKEADRLDAKQRPGTYPRASHEEAVRRWGKQASNDGPIAHVSLGEFGNQSHELATLWSGGGEVMREAKLQSVLDYFREKAGFDLGNDPIDLEKHRGENAAEKWIAAARASR